VGIWRFKAEGGKDGVDVGKLVCKVGFPNPLRPDVEGIALYRGTDGKGYLIAASEGSRDFVVLKREAPHDYVGRFKIGGNGSVDSVDDSGGLAVASGNFGGALGEGMLVLQDEKNENASGTVENQNFKIVPWAEVVRSLGL
jgi:3-phytase